MSLRTRSPLPRVTRCASLLESQTNCAATGAWVEGRYRHVWTQMLVHAHPLWREWPQRYPTGGQHGCFTVGNARHRELYRFATSRGGRRRSRCTVLRQVDGHAWTYPGIMNEHVDAPGA